MKEKSRGISCSLSDFKQILRVAKIALVFSILSVSFAFAQTRRVTGTVLDPDRAPVIGAYVSEVNNGQNGAVTDVQGRFSINVTGDAMLAVSYVGYTTMEIPTAGRTDVEIVLEQNIESMDEVVVVGYGTLRRSDLTGAVASVSQKDLLQLSTTDIGQALAGRVAGVDIVSNSGQPGGGTKIRIRGYGSLNDSNPLYVVDGIMVSDIDHIAPQDIESLEILKDASSTAIYGSRGSNGVILVQTKRGAYDSAPRISVNVYGSMNQIARKTELLNAWEFATLRREALANANLTESETMKAQFDYVINNKLHGTDWQDELTRIGWSQNYNIGVTGGGNRTNYSLGVTYSDQDGLLKYNDMKSIVIRANNTYKMNDHIELNTGIVIRNSKNNGGYGGTGNNNYYGGWSGLQMMDPLAPAWDSYTNNWGEDVYTDSLQPAQDAFLGSSKYRWNNNNRYQFNVGLNITDIGIRGLSFRTDYSVQSSNSQSKNFSPVYFIASNRMRDRSSLAVTSNASNSWQWTGFFSYINTFGKSNINATLGAEARGFRSDNLSGNASAIPEAENMWFLNQTTDPTSYTASNSTRRNAYASALARVNYSYDNKYVITATVRADGSFKFLGKYRWGYFPSFAAAWNIDNESFMQGQNLFSALKFRVGWGLVGNEASAGDFDYVALMTAAGQYNSSFGASGSSTGVLQKGVSQQAFANELLHWEASNQITTAIEFGMWNQKLTGTVEFFIRRATDMLLSTPIPQYAGMWRPTTNSGEMKNTGVELTLRWQERRGNFSYSISGNASFIKNKVTSLGNNTDPVYGDKVGRIQEQFTRTEVGKEMAFFYGLKTDGLFQTQAEIDAYGWTDDSGTFQKYQPQAAPGDVKFLKATPGAAGIIGTEDRVYLGSYQPDVTFGLNSNFQYKNVDLTLFLQGAVGGEIANARLQDLYSSNMTQWNMSKDMMKRWTGEGSTNEYPRMVSSDPNNNVRFSDRYIENGSYLRIKNIQVGYTFSRALTAKIGVERLRLYASVDNLHVFTKYRGSDPELGDYLNNPLQMGIDMASYPRSRVYTVGLNLNF